MKKVAIAVLVPPAVGFLVRPDIFLAARERLAKLVQGTSADTLRSPAKQEPARPQLAPGGVGMTPGMAASGLAPPQAIGELAR